jgi:quinol monooxygenase YgiN
MTFKHLCAAAFAFVLAACAGVPTPAVADAPANEEVTLIINFEASDAGLAEFSAIMDGVAGAMQTEAGFVSAKVYRNVDTPNKFVLVEVWETKALHEAHYKHINETGDWAHIKSLLTREPLIGYYTAD